MAFLDASVDLTGACFGAKDQKIARTVWQDVFRLYAPEWPEHPTGALAQLWESRTPLGVCRVIWIAKVLFNLSRAITKRSLPVFETKIRELLRLNANQFDELLTELEVASLLSERISPLSFEPLADQSVLGKKSPSPDYAIRLPDGDICIEVTVVHVHVFGRWDREVHLLHDHVLRSVAKTGLSRTVQLELPLAFRFDKSARTAITRLLETMASTTTGEATFPVGTEVGKATWHLHESHSLMGVGDGFNVLADPHGFLETEEHCQSFFDIPTSLVPSVGEDPNELVVRSLRRTIDRKLKRWGKHPLPYILVYKPGHRWIDPDGLSRMITERILENPVYRRLSGILRYLPPSGYRQSDKSYSLALTVNDNALHPLGQSVLAAFQGREQFHLS